MANGTPKQKEITLANILDISAAESFYHTLHEASTDSNSITLNAKKVERITTPCIQLILSLKKNI